MIYLAPEVAELGSGLLYRVGLIVEALRVPQRLWAGHAAMLWSMIASLWRRFRRNRLARKSFPPEWLVPLEQHVPFFAALEGPVRERFLELLKVFVEEKHFIGAAGLEITDEIRVVIAATAVRLVLYLDLGYYDRLTEIVVYPHHFRRQDDDPDTVVLGEAHDWGTIVLSWSAVLAGLRNVTDGHDTATHEFAHALDRAGGAFDGTPELRQWGHYQPWAEVMSHHFLRLRAGKRRERRVLRNYAATNEAEFFAVATEAFFEKPRQLRDRTPALYEQLSRLYGVDPLDISPSQSTGETGASG